MAVRIIAVLLSLMVFWLFVIPVPMGIINAGNITGMLVSAILMFVFIFWGRFSSFVSSLWEKPAGKIFVSVTSLFIAAGIVLAVVMSVCMAREMNDPPKNDNTTIVVLGCKVKNGRPSLMLARRLDAAYKYLSEHETVCAVVSGGQGSDEAISEAECMKIYLTEKGIAPERIFMEDKSTTTKENLAFSKKLIAENGLPQKVTLVTDGFHQLRAEMLAEKEGIDSPYNISGYTAFNVTPTYW
ncbi:MAG: YdcF family protein, partial [Ruminococcus sp.]|nr:YdcF family protein [Ruminococcus sp.]